MIKKSIFEQELISGMEKELRKIASNEPPKLSKAGEYLHSALEIFEELGLDKSADQILNLMSKIAATHHVKKPMPTLQQLLQVGLKPEDIKGMQEGNVGAKYRMNIALHNLGFGEREIAEYIGHKNIIPVKDLEAYKKMMLMIRNPNQSHEPVPSNISYETLAPDAESTPGITSLNPESLEFKSMAARPHKPRRPDMIPGRSGDRHTKNLTPEKMVSNLKHHGIVFNLADDGFDTNSSDFDADFADALGVSNADDLDFSDLDDADDFGYQEITDAEDNLQVSEQKLLDDFEDEVSPSK